MIKIVTSGPQDSTRTPKLNRGLRKARGLQAASTPARPAIHKRPKPLGAVKRPKRRALAVWLQFRFYKFGVRVQDKPQPLPDNICFVFSKRHSSSNCHWHRTVQRKSGESVVFVQSASRRRAAKAEGLAQSETLHVFQ